ADVPLKPLLGSKYLTRRRAMIDPQHASAQVSPGDPLKRAAHADTVYISAVGGDGLAVSFINSLFHSFGAGIVVPGTGICLHNRAALFSLNPDHPNAVAPHKRPYHTIIPALLFEGDDLRLCFGVMGGFMQPQGQVQVVCNVVDFNMDPQQALDAPRFRWLEGNSVAVEPGFDDATLADLQQRGHTLALNAEAQDFGGGQIIAVESETGTLTGASEPRKDGMAVGY
ncbi:MAG: gamma-glutamyltransferase, partial [Anaerolineae bacterium]